MADETVRSSKRFLSPHERISEILFGLIMVLTFTGTLSAAEAGRSDVRTMLLGALGCNVAWGIIDAVLYLMGCLAESNHSLVLFRAVRRTGEPDEARRLLSEALPPVVASVLRPEEFASLHARLKQLPEPPGRARLTREEWLAAIGVFVLVFLTTFPVSIPFLFMHNAVSALRVSNAVAIVLLFILGSRFGRVAGRRPWVTGVSMVLLGLVLVGITIALGG